MHGHVMVAKRSTGGAGQGVIRRLGTGGKRVWWSRKGGRSRGAVGPAPAQCQGQPGARQPGTTCSAGRGGGALPGRAKLWCLGSRPGPLAPAPGSQPGRQCPTAASAAAQAVGASDGAAAGGEIQGVTGGSPEVAGSWSGWRRAAESWEGWRMMYFCRQEGLGSGAGKGSAVQGTNTCARQAAERWAATGPGQTQRAHCPVGRTGTGRAP